LWLGDRFTKIANFVPFKSVPSDDTCAEQFFNSIFILHGLSEDVVSDRDIQFTSKLWNRLFYLLHVNSFNSLTIISARGTIVTSGLEVSNLGLNL